MEWIELPIKKTGDIVTGNTPSRSEEKYYGGNIPWIKPEDLDTDFYIKTSSEYLTEDGAKKARLLPENSILVSCIGNIGKMAIAGCQLATNQQINSVVPKEEYDPVFLAHSIKYSLSNEKNINIALVSILNGGAFGKVKVRLPKTKNEQKRLGILIQNKLVKIEQMRQAALKQKEAVEALQGALLREVFPYKEGDELPKGWKWEKLDNIAKVGKSRKKKTAANPKEPTSFVPMDSVDDVTGKITKTLFRPFDELGQSYTYFENGDIIFAKITPCMQNGKCAIISEMKDGFGYGSSEYIVLTPVMPIYTKWVHYFMRTVEFRKNCEDHFTGSAGQQRVPNDYIQKYLIPVPNDGTLIENFTNQLDKKHQDYFKLLQHTETQLEAIEAMPAAILREVFEFNKN